MRTLLSLGLAIGLVCNAARAGTPLGDDDTGFVPPDRVALVCAQKALLLEAKTVLKLTNCHKRLAADALAEQGIGSSEDACENAATSRLDGQLNRLFAQLPCPPCVAAGTATLGSDLETAADADNGDVFCTGTTTYVDIGQLDDGGFVPPDDGTLKCEVTVAKNLAKLHLCLVKCHIKGAKYAFRGRPFDEEACESTDPLRSCRFKYGRARDRIAPLCPPCLDSAAQDTLAAAVEANADANLGTFYCASASGAFVDTAD